MGVKHLGQDVVKGRRADDGKANKEDISLRIRQRPETVVIFLSSGVPQAQTYGLVVDHDIRRIIVEPARIVSKTSLTVAKD
jgi:hypothetical protein